MLGSENRVKKLVHWVRFNTRSSPLTATLKQLKMEGRKWSKDYSTIRVDANQAIILCCVALVKEIKK